MYSQTQYEVLMTPTNGSTTASGDTLQPYEWSPGLVPHIIRGFSVTLVSGNGNLTAGAIKLQSVSLASGSTAVDIATINLATTDLIGHTVYKQNMNTEIKPGTKVRVNVPAAIASGPLFKATIYVEPRWERPDNLTNMRETT